MATVLSLNPRGDVLYRTNYSLSPRAVDTASWVMSGMPGTSTQPSSGGPLASCPSYYRVTLSGAPTGEPAIAQGFRLNTPKNPTTPGREYTFSCYIRTSAANALRYAEFAWLNAASSQISTVQGVAVASAAGQWTRVSVTATAPEGAAFAQLNARLSSGGPLPGAGGTFDATGFLYEAGPVAGTYFDGSAPAAGGYSYTWVGGAHASISREYGPDPETTTTAVFALGVEIEREQRSIMHEYPLTGNVAVVERPAGVRSGTIVYLFEDYATARRAEIIHSRAGRVVMVDPDWPGGGMTYLPQEQSILRLDEGTRRRWLFETGFKEIPA